MKKGIRINKIIASMLCIGLVLTFSACESQSVSGIDYSSDMPSEESGWYQRLTDEDLAKAEYISDQGIENAVKKKCVLLYKDESRDFSLYFSYLNDDIEEILIISNGKRIIEKRYGHWFWSDLRKTTVAYDLDSDGFEEIVTAAITGTGSGFLETSFFVFDSSDGVTYDKLFVCGPEGIVFYEENHQFFNLQDVSATIEKDGTVTFKQGDNVKYQGHIKGLLERFPGIDKVRLEGWICSLQTEDGKMMFVSRPFFYGGGVDMGGSIQEGDTENDACDVIYEIEYSKDGTFKCVSVRFERVPGALLTPRLVE